MSTTPTATRTCLGILLGTREVGLAVATRETLLHEGVLNLRKIASREGREARFRQVVLARFDRFAVTQVAVTALTPATPSALLVNAERAWLEAECARRGVPLRSYSREEVRRDPQRPGGGLTHRDVAMRASARFPELAKRCPTYQVTPASGVPSRDRYWFRMFTALAVALLDLDRELLERLDA